MQRIEAARSTLMPPTLLPPNRFRRITVLAAGCALMGSLWLATAPQWDSLLDRYDEENRIYYRLYHKSAVSTEPFPKTTSPPHWQK
ncbi:MAG: hypothetical protein KY468_05350, partial [Armatimonadetes bacterium]|nr:hypothetical protein [Armatimonadota bacterium]